MIARVEARFNRRFGLQEHIAAVIPRLTLGLSYKSRLLLYIDENMCTSRSLSTSLCMTVCVCVCMCVCEVINEMPVT